MPRSIDEIELDSLPLHTYWSELDRDTSFTLEIHLIERLRLHLTLLEGSCDLHEAISERGLAMIDMGNDTKIADGNRFGHGDIIGKKSKKAKRTDCKFAFLRKVC